MIHGLLTQSTIWRSRTGSDKYGKAAFAADTVVACRWEWKRRIIRTPAGQEVVSEGKVFVTAVVSEGDQVVDPLGRSWTVLGVTPQYGLNGRESYREAFV